MNKRLQKQLFKFPITIFPLMPVDSMGDAEEASPISLLCYKMEGAEVVVNSLGEEERSGTQIYLPGHQSTVMKVEDLVTCEEIIKQRIIKKSVFYLPQGVADVVVLYLP